MCLTQRGTIELLHKTLPWIRLLLLFAPNVKNSKQDADNPSISPRSALCCAVLWPLCTHQQSRRYWSFYDPPDEGHICVIPAPETHKQVIETNTTATEAQYRESHHGTRRLSVSLMEKHFTDATTKIRFHFSSGVILQSLGLVQKQKMGRKWSQICLKITPGKRNKK